MSGKTKNRLFSSNFLYWVGTLFGFVLTIIIVWGDLEGSLFTSGIKSEKNLSTLHCPVIITPSESGQISATLRNPTEKMMTRYTRAHVTEGYVSLVREIIEEVEIEPGGKSKITWDIRAEDAAYNRIVLFRVYINAKYPYPSLGGTCGVIRLDIPYLQGWHILGLLILGSAGLIGAGLYLRRNIAIKAKSFEIETQAMLALVVALAGSALIGYLGYWVFGVIGLACSLLLLGIIIGRKLSY